MNPVPVTVDTLWDSLRDVTCSTGRNAHRIVLVHKSDIEKALAAIAHPICPHCESNSGYTRSVGRDNDEIVEDCPHCNPPKSIP